MKATLGDCRDLPLCRGREATRATLETMRSTGRTPAEAKEAARDKLRVADMTVAECVELYRRHLVERAQPAKDSSLRGLERALKRPVAR